MKTGSHFWASKGCWKIKVCTKWIIKITPRHWLMEWIMTMIWSWSALKLISLLLKQTKEGNFCVNSVANKERILTEWVTNTKRVKLHQVISIMKRKSFTFTTLMKPWNKGTSTPTTKALITSNEFNKTTLNKLIINHNKCNQAVNKQEGKISTNPFSISMPLFPKNKLQEKSLSIKHSNTKLITETLATTFRHLTALTIPMNPNLLNNSLISTHRNSPNNTKFNSTLKSSQTCKDSKVSIDPNKYYDQTTKLNWFIPLSSPFDLFTFYKSFSLTFLYYFNTKSLKILITFLYKKASINCKQKYQATAATLPLLWSIL